MLKIRVGVRTWSQIYQEDQTTNDGYETSQFQYTANEFYAQSVWKKSYLKEFISESYLAKTFNSLEEVTLMMMRLHAPPIIREHIEGAQYDDEERC